MRILLLLSCVFVAACSQEPAPLASGEGTVIDGQIKAYNDAKGLEQQINSKAQDDKRNIDQQINP